MEYAYKKDWWETKDHEKIKISDMETLHIENTIKFLQRHEDFYDEEYGFYDYDNGEMFYDYEDNSHLVDKKIEELENELKRRNENMKKAPKVLTRMRLSCCWGDNLDEKELNDIVDYINELEHQDKKQKEVIDKVNEVIDKMINIGYSSGVTMYCATGEDSEFGTRAKIIKDILKEVSK